MPYAKEDLDAYAQELHLVFDRDWFMVAENAGGETVGVAITIPDINEVLKRMGGRVLPFGWWHYLRRRRIVDRCRIGFLGRQARLPAHRRGRRPLHRSTSRCPRRRRIKWGEAGWVLETNKGLNRGMEALGGRIRRKYRIYERAALSHADRLARCPNRPPFRIRSEEADVRPLPVLAEPRPVERPREVSLPAAVAAATGGFLLGIATFVLVRVLRRPRSAATLRLRRRRRARQAGGGGGLALVPGRRPPAEGPIAAAIEQDVRSGRRLPAADPGARRRAACAAATA